MQIKKKLKDSLAAKKESTNEKTNHRNIEKNKKSRQRFWPTGGVIPVVGKVLYQKTQNLNIQEVKNEN